MYIKQLSVYIENVKGSLRELVELLGKNEINLVALSISDTTGFGIIRFIVKSADVEKTMNILGAGGYIAKVNDVICVQIPHKPLGFANILKILEENNISVEYTYSFCQSTLDDAVMIIRPSDKEKSIAVLNSAGVTIVSQQQVDSF